MPDVSPLSFTLRDIFQKVFPTIIAVCLFAPFIKSPNEPLGVEEIIFAGVILGYLLTLPVKRAGDFFAKYSPLLRSRRKNYEKRRQWVARNWDYDLLFNSLSKDERELIEEDGNPFVFYRAVSLYLFAYFIWNLFHLARALYDLGDAHEIWTGQYWRKAWPVLAALKTPVLVVGEVPTYVLLPLVLLLIYFSVSESLEAYKYTLLEGGVYDGLSQKYQKNSGGIAISIWGRVLQQGESKKDKKEINSPVVGPKVILLKDGIQIAETNIDEDGYFQFVNRYHDCLNATCTVRVSVGNRSQEESKKFDDKTVIPSFDFIFPPNPQPDANRDVGLFRRAKDALSSLARRIRRRFIMSEHEKIEELIRNIPKLAVSGRQVESAELGREPEIYQGIHSMKIRKKWRESGSVDTLTVLNAKAAALWPGSLVQGKTICDGTFDVINLGRRPAQITLNVLAIARGSDAPACECSVLVDAPGPESIANEIKKFASQIPPGTSARLSHKVHQFYSPSHALYLIGVPVDWLDQQQRERLDAAYPPEQTNFIVQFIKSYYSVAFEKPSSPSSVFASEVLENAVKPHIVEGNPLAYVSKITYGQALYAFVSSKCGPLELRAALNAALLSVSEPDQIQLTPKQTELLKRSKIQAVVLGQADNNVAFLENLGFEQLSQLLREGVVFNAGTAAVPVSCQLCYLIDNSVVSFPLALDYELVSYQPQNITSTTVTFNVTNDKPATEELRLTVLCDGEQIGCGVFGQLNAWGKHRCYPCHINLHRFTAITRLKDLRLCVYKTPGESSAGGGMKAALIASCVIEDGTVLHWADIVEMGFEGRTPYQVIPPAAEAV